MTWRVHADTSMLVAGMTAFALQTLHPRAMAGVWDHSAFGGDFFGRTRRTGEFVQGVVYDPSAAAERRCDGLRRIHDRVVGHTPDGRPYSAGDPDLLEWVHVTEYLAIASANRRFAAHPMSRAELDTYVAEVARVGSAVGVVDPPRSWAELDAAFRRHAPDLAVGEQAATAVRLPGEPAVPAGGGPPAVAGSVGRGAGLPPAAGPHAAAHHRAASARGRRLPGPRPGRRPPPRRAPPPPGGPPAPRLMTIEMGYIAKRSAGTLPSMAGRMLPLHPTTQGASSHEAFHRLVRSNDRCLYSSPLRRRRQPCRPRARLSTRPGCEQAYQGGKALFDALIASPLKAVLNPLEKGLCGENKHAA